MGDYSPQSLLKDVATGGQASLTKASTKAAKKGVQKAGEAITPDMPELPVEKVAPIPDDLKRKAAIERFLARSGAGGGRSATKLTSKTLG